MPGNARDMIFSAERRFPVRIRIGVPPDGFGQRYAHIAAWLDENCDADGWAMTPSGMRRGAPRRRVDRARRSSASQNRPHYRPSEIPAVIA